VRNIEIHCIRLKKGEDIKKSIVEYSVGKKIMAGVVLSSVGCVTNGRLRLADGKTIKELSENLEIISINGTISLDGAHLHISFGDKDGLVLGGHMLEGNIVNTTCELVIGELKKFDFKRYFDEETGYNELKIK
jgi:predicted DNA-binding protein with PD1-like motif